MFKLPTLALIVVAALTFGTARAEEPLQVHAAGSLKSALTEAGADFTRREAIPVSFQFAPSGLLKERLAKGEASDVFASANMEHPRALAEAGLTLPVVRFARNRLCALASPKLTVSSDTLLQVMLDPAVRLGTSTPKADPAGDYAWKLFERAEKLQPGAFEKLSAKALKLTGGPQSPAPKDRNVYGMLMAEGAADLFLTYCTNALQAKQEVPDLAIVAIPEPLAVGAEYGLAVFKSAPPAAQRFADYLTDGEGQAILVKYGFSSGK